jgi:hypothetical protein
MSTMGPDVITSGDRLLPNHQQREWKKVVDALRLPISPYIAKAAYVYGLLGQTVDAAKLCWGQPGQRHQPYVLGAFTLASSAIDLLGHCLGKRGNEARLRAGLGFLATVPCNLAGTPMLSEEPLIAVRHFTTHGAVHSKADILLSEEQWRRVLEPLEAAPSVFWAARPDAAVQPVDEDRFAAFAKAPITALRTAGEVVFVRDVYEHLTAAAS